MRNGIKNEYPEHDLRFFFNTIPRYDTIGFKLSLQMIVLNSLWHIPRAPVRVAFYLLWLKKCQTWRLQARDGLMTCCRKAEEAVKRKREGRDRRGEPNALCSCPAHSTFHLCVALFVMREGEQK